MRHFFNGGYLRRSRTWSGKTLSFPRFAAHWLSITRADLWDWAAVQISGPFLLGRFLFAPDLA
jgi:hypothetical protein